MRLNELTGYQQRPETAEIKSALGPLADDPSVEDRRYILQSFLEKVKARGFRPLGHGVFGAVLTHPGLNYAIKIFKNDAAYLAIVKYMLANQSNPMIPKFRGKLCNLGEDFFFVRMELLNPKLSEDALLTVAVLEFYSRYPSGMTNSCLDMIRDKPHLITNRYPNFSPRKVLDEADDLEGGKEIQTIAAIRSLADKARFKMDIKPDNFMMRGDQLVITDPIYDPNAISLF